MRRLIRTVRAFLRRHFTGHPTPTRAERIVRVGTNVDCLFFADNGKAVRIDVTLWEAEMNAHLLMLDDGIALLNELLAWGADA